MISPWSDAPCGFCGHLFAAHPSAAAVVAPMLAEPQGVMWPCIAEGCDCDDFALPGSVLELGEITDN